uniref:Uncharacterized protein n=1 Tax=Psittacine aviadenovirus B TaxID=2169709 RepID=A0AB38ZPE6_9ADEN
MTVTQNSRSHWYCGSPGHIGSISFSTLMSPPGPVIPLTDPETYMRQKLAEAAYSAKGMASRASAELHSRAVYHCRAGFTAAVTRKKQYFLQSARIDVEVPSSQLSKKEKEAFLKDLVSVLFNASTKTLRATDLCLEAAEGRLGIRFRFHSGGFRVPDTTALKVVLSSLKLDVNDAATEPAPDSTVQGYARTFTLQNRGEHSLEGTFSRDTMLKHIHPMYHKFVPLLSQGRNGEGVCSQVAERVQGGSAETWVAHVHQPRPSAGPISLRNASTLALIQACLATNRDAGSTYYPLPFHPYLH